MLGVPLDDLRSAFCGPKLQLLGDFSKTLCTQFNEHKRSGAAANLDVRFSNYLLVAHTQSVASKAAVDNPQRYVDCWNIFEKKF